MEGVDARLTFASAPHVLMNSEEVTTPTLLVPVLLPVSYRFYNGTFSLGYNVTTPGAFVISDYALTGQDGSLHRS